MFMQILVNEDVEFQRIFWRERLEEPLKEYRLLTVTYGTACAPYLSIRTIQLAEEEIKKFPEASKVALEDIYNRNKFERKRQEISKSSNRTHEERRINISPPNEVRPTKRQLLSTIAKIYDPLGFLSPTKIQLKILMQDIMKEIISWDDPIRLHFRIMDAIQESNEALSRDSDSKIPFRRRYSKASSYSIRHHGKSEENLADCASRGIAASKLKVHKLWWSGPQSLSQDSLHFPSIDLSTSCEDVKCEEKSSTVLTNASTSSQGSYLLFHSEIQLLKKKHPLPNSSKLLPLGIFLDTDGIIKVGGRLKNSSLSPIQKHPILLPKSHRLTNLVIHYFHHINLHSGPQLTLCCIRQKFWIPSGRGVVGRLLSKCQTWFRFKAKSGEQLMGNLPANRFSAGRAFLNVGIDFGGPFIIKPSIPQSKVKLKSYLALFICMAIKAVHLEVVSDLSADAFLAAFRRFMFRRGNPTNMFSDNATNFKGASSYLKEQLKLIKSVEVQNFVTQESITWHFIPPTTVLVGRL
ncbi:integrase catalytic domain-containing protein [Trichonephila clavipes]|uniref:Integrase catalytic domain-containing protein n=1 Tax=Trichonephila clavipes TaxID=2585209 RepID=A0A8X6V5M9_TRICX|nr:integrase catalytic domain-containing protein [Trichonephila clavipes]